MRVDRHVPGDVRGAARDDGRTRRRALLRRRRHRAATSHGHDVPAGAPGHWGLREEVRAGCGVHRRVRAVPGVRRVYVRGCARASHRVGTSLGVLCFVDTVGAGVELHVHRGIRAHVTRRSGAGRGRLEAGAGCRGGCDVRGGGRGVGGFGGASRRHRLAGALRLRRAVRGGYDVVRVQRGVRGCDQLLAEPELRAAGGAGGRRGRGGVGEGIAR